MKETIVVTGEQASKLSLAVHTYVELSARIKALEIQKASCAELFRDAIGEASGIEGPDWEKAWDAWVDDIDFKDIWACRRKDLPEEAILALIFSRHDFSVDEDGHLWVSTEFQSYTYIGSKWLAEDEY